MSRTTASSAARSWSAAKPKRKCTSPAGARGMDRRQADAVALEHFEQRAQGSRTVVGQVHRERRRFQQVGQQVGDAFERMIALAQHVRAVGIAAVVQEAGTERRSRRLAAAAHQVAQCGQLVRQSIEHLRHVRVVELDVFVDLRIEREDPGDDRMIHLERGRAHRQQRRRRPERGRMAANDRGLGEMGRMHHRLDQGHRPIVMLGIDAHDFRFEGGQQFVEPAAPAIKPHFAYRQHPPLQGRRLRRRGHRMQADHLRLRAAHRRHRRLLDRGDVQPEATTLAPGRARDAVVDDGDGMTDRRSEQQHVGGVEEVIERLAGRIGRVEADDRQQHALLEEFTEPSAIGALAADEADHWRGEHRSCSREGRASMRSRPAGCKTPAGKAGVGQRGNSESEIRTSCVPRSSSRHP